MKRINAQTYLAILAVSGMAVLALPHNASAQVTITSENSATLPVSNSDPFTATFSGDFYQGVTTSSTDNYLSPFAGSADASLPYSVLSSSGISGPTGTPGTQGNTGSPAATPGSATYYFITPSTTAQILWGSPDSYNFLAFYSSSNVLLGSFNLASLQQAPAACNNGSGSSCPNADTGFDFVTFSSTTPIAYAILTDPCAPGLGTTCSNAGQQAFEYADFGQLGGGGIMTPIPAAAALILGGFGLIGLLTQRRKRSVPASQSQSFLAV
jgi:hypothetical protein